MIFKPATTKRWAVCPYCGAKTILYDNRAECSGVWVKCTRGCKSEFELVIEDGEQKNVSHINEK